MKAKPLTEIQKFTSDIVWVAISQVLMALTALVILPALTKSYTSEIYGIWMQVIVTVGLLTPILSLHLGTALVRFLAAEEDKEKRRYAFGAMLWPILAFACVVLLISVLLRQNLSLFLFADSLYISLVPLTFLWALMETLFFFSISYLRARGRIKRLSVVQLALSITKMSLIITLTMVGYSLGWIIGCLIVVEAFFVATVFAMIFREVGFPRFGFGGLKRYLAFSVPQIPSGILLWIMSASDRYFITHLLNLSQAGIYSASYSLGSGVALFFWPISFVLFPTVSKFWEQKEIPKVRDYFEYSTKLSLAGAIPAAAGLFVLSQPLLHILTTSEYMVGGGLVLLVALGTIFLGIYQINLYIIYLVEQTKWLPLMIGIAAFSNAGINIILIPQIGIMAAAISTVVSYFLLATIVTIWARRAINYKMDLKFLSKVIIATLVMALCLRFIPTGSVLGITLAIIAGAAIFALGLFLSKAFSREDRRLVKEVLSGLNPRLTRDNKVGKHNGFGERK